MAKKSAFPMVDVAVTLLTHGSSILAVYNSDWGAFTLPMTKRRQWWDPQIPKSEHFEDWLDAAARAAAEWLGRTCTPELLLEDTGEYQQSDRDGQWKRFHFQIYRLQLEAKPQLVQGAIAEWLSAKDFYERRPISRTAQYLLKRVQEEGLL